MRSACSSSMKTHVFRTVFRHKNVFKICGGGIQIKGNQRGTGWAWDKGVMAKVRGQQVYGLVGAPHDQGNSSSTSWGDGSQK